LDQTNGQIDAIVLTAGTGGTISGIAKKLKERIPEVKIVGVDPHGSILAEPSSLNTRQGSYKVEGIGYDFIPDVLDRSLVDSWIKTDDKESFIMARRLIREEGLLCGGSSGSAMVAALQVAKNYKKGQRVVVLLADSVRNYMSKFLNDSWMFENSFFEKNTNSEGQTDEWWSRRTVADLQLKTPSTISPKVTCNEAVHILEEQGYDQLPVVDETGEVLGVVTAGNLMANIISNRVKRSDSVSSVLYRHFKKVSLYTDLATVSTIFSKDHFALVTATQTWFSNDTQVQRSLVVAVATPIDLVNYILKNAPLQ